MTRELDLGDILGRLQGRARTQLDVLLPEVYDELKAVAHRCLASEYAATVNTTSLVHETYIHLSRENQTRWQDKRHFLALAALVMRRLLVSHARSRLRQKRGGDVVKVSLDEAEGVFADERVEEIVRLDSLLDQLAKVSERAARVVEYRFFGGLSVEETATTLGVSTITVKRDWVTAKAWLQREFQQNAGSV